LLHQITIHLYNKYLLKYAIITSPRERCELLRCACMYASVCLSVCLSVCSHISKTMRPNFTRFSMHDCDCDRQTHAHTDRQAHRNTLLHATNEVKSSKILWFCVNGSSYHVPHFTSSNVVTSKNRVCCDWSQPRRTGSLYSARVYDPVCRGCDQSQRTQFR